MDNLLNNLIRRFCGDDYKEGRKKLFWVSFCLCFIFVNFCTNFYYSVMLHKPIEILSLLLMFRYFALGSYVIVAILSFVLAAAINIKISGVVFETNKHQEKDSRLITDPDEMKKIYKLVPEREESFPGSGGSPIARYEDKIFIDTILRNQLIVGTTRAGKGETQVKPSLDLYTRAEDQPSLVITDPKGELTRSCYNNFVERGYKVQVFNLIDYKRSDLWNPLTEIIREYEQGDVGKAVELIESFAITWFGGAKNHNDPYWDMNSRAGFSAMICALLEDGLRDNKDGIILYGVYQNFKTMMTQNVSQKTGLSDLDRYFQKKRDRAQMYDEESLSSDYYFSIELSSGKTRSSIFSHLITFLRPFITPTFAKLTSKSEIELTELGFGEKPVAIFICTPPMNEALYKLASLMLSQMFAVNINMAEKNNSKFKRQIKGVYEECGNIPNIDKLDTQLSLGSGYGFTADLYFQNDAQISKYDSKVGGQVKNTIYSNCNNKFFLITDDEDTRKKFSGMSGTAKIKSYSKSGGFFSLSKNITENDRNEPLVSASQLLHLKEGEQLVIRTLSRRNNSNEKIKPFALLTQVSKGTDLKFAHTYIPEFNDNPETNPRAIVPLLRQDRQDIVNLDLQKMYYRLKFGYSSYAEPQQDALDNFAFNEKPAAKESIDDGQVLSDIFDVSMITLVRRYLNDIEKMELDFSTFTKTTFLLYLESLIKNGELGASDFGEIKALLQLEEV